MLQKIAHLSIGAFLLLCGAISSAQSAEWRWNGYFGAHYEGTSSPGSYGSFDAFTFSLVNNIQIDEKSRVYSQINYLHGPSIDIKYANLTKKAGARSSGEINLSNMYVQYSASDLLKISLGKFLAPIGLYNQLFYTTVGYPTMMIPGHSVYMYDMRGGYPESDVIFFQKQAMGLWLSGVYSFAKTDVAYDIYMANGRTFEYQTDVNAGKSIGGRIRLSQGVGQFEITPMVSYYSDEFNAANVELNPAETTPKWRTQSSIIPGIEVERGNLVLRGEYAASGWKTLDGTTDKDFSAYYLEGYYTLWDKLTPFARYELYDADTAVTNDQAKTTEVGIAYHLIPWLSLVKLTMTMRSFDNPMMTSYSTYMAGVALGF